MAHIFPIGDDGIVTTDVSVEPRADESGFAVAAATPQELPLQVAPEIAIYNKKTKTTV